MGTQKLRRDDRKDERYAELHRRETGADLADIGVSETYL